MVPDRVACQLPLNINSESNFNCIWQRDPSLTSAVFNAQGTVWIEGTQIERIWRASINFTTPAFHVCMIVEEVRGGSWRLFTMPPVMDVSTFWWASALFLESIKQHPQWVSPYDFLKAKNDAKAHSDPSQSQP